MHVPRPDLPHGPSQLVDNSTQAMLWTPLSPEPDAQRDNSLMAPALRYVPCPVTSPVTSYHQ